MYIILEGASNPTNFQLFPVSLTSMPEKERALSVNTVGERERKGEKEKKRERGSSRQSKERTPVKSSKDDREKERRRTKDKENEKTRDEKDRTRSSREKVEKKTVIDSGTWDKRTKESLTYFQSS